MAVRGVYYSVDPAGYRLLLPGAGGTLPHILMCPTVLAVSVLILNHWNRIASLMKETPKHLYRIIMGIVSVLVFVTLLYYVLMLFLDIATVVAVFSVFFSFNAMLLSVYSLITVPRVYKDCIKKIMSEYKRQVVERKMYLIIIICILSIIWAIIPLVFVLQTRFYAVYSYITLNCWFIVV